MLKQSLPKEPILKRALAGLLILVMGLVAAGGFAALDNSDRARPEAGRKLLTQAVWQYGVNSQQVKDVIAQMGQEAGGQGVVALLDPNTGVALAASPAGLVGKKPEEMTLPNGVKLPSLPLMQSKGRFALERFHEQEGQGIQVTTSAIFPWYETDAYDQGRPVRKLADVGRYSRGDRYGYPGKEIPGWAAPTAPVPGAPAAPAPAAVQTPPNPPAPLAILLTAFPPSPLSVWRILAMAAGALAFLGFVLYWLSIAWWVFTDAHRRKSNRAIIWGALALVTNLVGVLVYLIARREQATCGACGEPVEKAFSHCPHCGNQLKHSCSECGAPLKEGWEYCPQCGHAREK